MRTLISLITTTAILFAMGCSTAPETGTGTLEVRLHDAPGDYEQVNVFIERVEVNRAEDEEGWIVLNEPKQQYNLLELVNGVYEVIGEAELEPGTYNQIRLILSADNNNVVIDGEQKSLMIPSGQQTGIKLNVDAEIREGIQYVLLLDFDVDRSVVTTGQGDNPGYLLKPVIRAVNEAVTGNIGGTVSQIESRSVAYAIADTDTIASTYADVDSGSFLLVGLEEGSYRVSIESREDGFQSYEYNDVNVTAGETTGLGEIELQTE